MAHDNDCKDVIVACGSGIHQISLQIRRWLARCETMVLVTLGQAEGRYPSKCPDGMVERASRPLVISVINNVVDYYD